MHHLVTNTTGHTWECGHGLAIFLARLPRTSIHMYTIILDANEYTIHSIIKKCSFNFISIQKGEEIQLVLIVVLVSQ